MDRCNNPGSHRKLPFPFPIDSALLERPSLRWLPGLFPSTPRACDRAQPNLPRGRRSDRGDGGGRAGPTQCVNQRLLATRCSFSSLESCFLIQRRKIFHVLHFRETSAHVKGSKDTEEFPLKKSVFCCPS